MEYVPTKTTVTKVKDTSRFGTDHNMSIHRGCCHGCVYCDSHSDCYQIDSFDTVRAKKDALRIIRDDSWRKVKLGAVGTGSMSDSYNPPEEEMQLIRYTLGLINASGFDVAIATKSTLVMRDVDVLENTGEHSPALHKVAITTAGDALSKKVELHMTCSSEWFVMLDALGSCGIYTGILSMLVLPFLEDPEGNVLAIVCRAHEAGVRFIYLTPGMTPRNNQREQYFDKLDEIPLGQSPPEQRIKRYGNHCEHHNPRARTLWNKFTQRCVKYGILYDMKGITHSYKENYEVTQLNMFDQHPKTGTYRGE